MTEIFPDPFEEFLAQDPTILRDPYALTGEELAQAQTVERGSNRVAVAVGLAAAYLVYRQYMARRLQPEVTKMAGNVTRKSMLLAASAVWNAFVPRWVSMTAPYLIAGYIEGMRAADAGQVPLEDLRKIAEDYAKKLGEHINDVSKEAMISGFQTQVNRKVPTTMAARRVVDAYGVPKRGMNALVNVWASEEKPRMSDQPLPSAKADRAKILIEAQHALRARQIGENEAWTARTQAKQIVWMYGQETGAIPESARRVWITANDERVCEVCGPMDGKDAPVGEKFETKNGQFWTPPSHVNCRCDVVLDLMDLDSELERLVASERVGKAYATDPFDRDKKGRFARTESRSVRHKEREAQVDAMLQQVNQALQGIPLQEQKLERPSLKAQPLSLARPSLAGPSLKQVALGPPKAKLQAQLQRAELPKPELKLRLAGGNLFSTEKIRLHPIETNEGKWEVWDEVLTAVVPPWRLDPEQDLVLMDEEDDFYVETSFFHQRDDLGPKTLYQAIGDYWEGWVQEQMTEYYDKSSRNGGVMLYEDEYRQGFFHVDAKDYQKVLEDVINGETQGTQAEITLFMSNDPQARPVKVRSGEIADYFHLREKAEEEAPILVQTHHGLPGSTEQVDQFVYTNPGRWRVVHKKSLYTDDVGDYHPMPYQIWEVEPEDLLDD